MIDDPGDTGAADIDARAAAVLVAHQRKDITGCICGWAELGRSHAEHVVRCLRAVEVLRGS